MTIEMALHILFLLQSIVIESKMFEITTKTTLKLNECKLFHTIN